MHLRDSPTVVHWPSGDHTPSCPATAHTVAERHQWLASDLVWWHSTDRQSADAPPSPNALRGRVPARFQRELSTRSRDDSKHRPKRRARADIRGRGGRFSPPSGG